jgi:hypothetical protein
MWTCSGCSSAWGQLVRDCLILLLRLAKFFFSSSYSLSVSLVDVLFVVRVIQLMFRLLALLIAAVKNLAALYLFFLLEQNL